MTTRTPPRIDLTMAAGLAIASLAAFSIATALGYAHAYWAAMSVWVVAQPYRDHVIQRGVFRLIGTVIGAAAGAGIIWLNMGPMGSLLLTCLWVALVGGAQNLWNTASRYIAFMAAMTAAVVILPNLLSPAPELGVAMERVLCVMIGVISAMVVVGIVTPASPEWQARRAEKRGGNDALTAPPRTAPDRQAWLKAWRSGLVAGGGTLAFGTMGILSDYRPAELSALGFCIFALILGGLAKPGKVAPILFLGVAVGLATAALYRIGVLPMVTTPWLAVVSLVPFILLGALARAFQPTAAPALDANMVFLLIGQGSLLASTDWQQVTVEALSVLVAAACATVVVAMIVTRQQDQ